MRSRDFRCGRHSPQPEPRQGVRTPEHHPQRPKPTRLGRQSGSNNHRAHCSRHGLSGNRAQGSCRTTRAGWPRPAPEQRHSTSPGAAGKKEVGTDPKPGRAGRPARRCQASRPQRARKRRRGLAANVRSGPEVPTCREARGARRHATESGPNRGGAERGARGGRSRISARSARSAGALLSSWSWAGPRPPLPAPEAPSRPRRPRPRPLPSWAVRVSSASP